MLGWKPYISFKNLMKDMVDKDLENYRKKWIFRKKLLEKIIKKNRKVNYSDRQFPLIDDAFEISDLMSGVDVLLKGKITMSEVTKNFEKQFSRYVGSKYALMVNSGSSANLLSMFSLVNPKNKKN